jgi:LAO/AO transport system kinase
MVVPADRLVEGIRAGDRRSLARAITLAESTRADHRALALAVLEALLPDTGNATRVGISGTPGVGKSRLIEALGLHLVERNHRVAVLAVDPSSTRSGGSILGDKTRMGELARHPAAFIRPSPSKGTLGGLASRTREVMLLCEAFGFDVVLVETVGVGQSETAVDELVDVFVLLVQPGAGDDLQAIKRGVMELADLVVVTKADGELAGAAARAVADYTHALRLIRPKHADWPTPALMVSAATGAGVNELWDAIAARHDALERTGILARRRAEQAAVWLWSELTDGLVNRFRDDRKASTRLGELETAVREGTMSPSAAAALLLEQ